MNVTEDLSILSLILQASVVVKIVMAILAGVSFMSWYWIFFKAFTIRSTRNATTQFEQSFWSGGDLVQLYRSISADRDAGGSARVAAAAAAVAMAAAK